MRELLSVYVKGVFMGAADSVPGVSGGTIALITGIYERLITAIAAADPAILLTVARIGSADGRMAFRDKLREMDIGFLLALGAGVLTGLVTVTRVVLVALDEYEALTFAFFFGLIAASAIVLYKHVSVGTPRRAMVAVLGFVLAFLLSAEATGGFPHALPVVFLAGTIAISAMILPGISGALLLMLLGQFEHLSGTLEALTGALANLLNGGSVDALVQPGTVVATFAAGAAVGLLTISRLIKWAMEHYYAATLTFLVSLMVGALRLPAAKVLKHAPDLTPVDWGAILLTAVVGAGLVLVLDYYTDDLEYERDVTPVRSNKAD